ncbi:HlyD family type I secretion periplasmic adaptor subunit [Cognatishimia sp. SS12]|uniref:HlyD family type I secretion periplasmic adaptor subunit n=1 Tax=Cognatishimia sp. SS12 TaxID=2979465 RepID=UPI00232FC7E7|nr:HlyD family type I secretion periplasmic adaptor subunit [Cognatishimia sp. SS12]MDC0737584.1 HlyD family type I secretion periplasmic adaptor subunit [Cognatishimia sp. SS12]
MPRLVIMGLVLIWVMIGGFGLWAAQTQLAAAIIAEGTLTSSAARQLVQHPQGGQIAELRIAEGDTVRAGQPLLILRGQRLASEVSVMEGQLFELLARRARLEAERDGLSAPVFAPRLLRRAATHPDIDELIKGQARLFTARRDSLRQTHMQLTLKLAQIDDRMAGLTAQETALDRQFNLISKERASQKTLLERGLTQAARVLALEREEARLAGQRGELRAVRAQAKGQSREITLERERATAAYREEAITTLRDLQYREIELTERLSDLQDRAGDKIIRAPVSGVVHDLAVHSVGAVIRPADILMAIVPQNKLTLVTVKLPPAQADQAYAGQQVDVVFPGLDQRQTSKMTGEVTRISADVLEDARSGQPYYSAEIRLSEAALDALPSDVALRPGMPVQSFLRIKERSALAYLLEPFTSYFETAFREN